MVQYEREEDRIRQTEVARQIEKQWNVDVLETDTYCPVDYFIIDETTGFPRAFAELRARNL